MCLAGLAACYAAGTLPVSAMAAVSLKVSIIAALTFVIMRTFDIFGLRSEWHSIRRLASRALTAFSGAAIE